MMALSEKPKRFQRVGVVGAGVIGSGVAQLFAQTGHEVVLVDNSPAQLDRARTSIGKNLRLYNLLNPGQNAAEAAKRLTYSANVGDLSDSQFVIENITEDWELKREVHGHIDATIAAEAYVGVNTSAIPITRVGSAGLHPQRVIGMHFMNPPPLMPLVEVIRGVHTSDETIAAAQELVAQAGKQSIVVNDSPGFVTNRVMMLMVNEAMFLVHEGVASVQDVDRLFKTCFGHKMGPLETADLIGLDTVLKSLEVIYDELKDSKYRPCPLLQKMVYANRNGRKSGKGFYDYGIPGPAPTP
jgi:3-hydroxybutyryl-CoA dehydrogenase